MPTAEKAVKERDCTQCGKERKNRPQMPVAKKERPNHKCWWQTKYGCPNQKQLKPPQKPKWLPTYKHKVKRRKKSPPITTV